MKTPYEIAYEQLNAEQKKAVDTIEGPVMVIAGPGTGKTQVLTLRIANILLKTQVEPENILALTFTESAAHEMRQRLVSLIGSAGYRAEIQTFHGFCNRLIQYNNTEFEDLISAESIDDLEQIEIIEKILEEGNFRFIRPFGSPLYYLKALLRAIGELKKESVTWEEFTKTVIQQEKDLAADTALAKEKTKYAMLDKKIKRNKELAVVYREYEAALRRLRKYDYHDMLLHVIRTFKADKNLLLSTQELFQYILVDEHQDTNKAQNTIIELLSSYYKSPNLFVVGDEKQAIFRFQGATLENFLYFKELYKDAVLINLKSNYRSTQTILDAAGSLISHNAQKGIMSDLVAMAGRKELPVSVVKLSSYFAEYRYVAAAIQEQIAAGVKPQDIAVLMRTNRDVYEMAGVLDQEHIPYCIDSDQSIFKETTIEKIVALLYAIHKLGSDTELITAMHLRVFGIDPLDVFRLIRYAQEKKTFLWEVLSAQAYTHDLHLSTPEAVRSCVEKIKTWKTESMNDSFDNVFISILNGSGYLPEVMKQKDNLTVIEKISALFTQIKRQVAKNHAFNLDSFIEYIEKVDKHGLSLTVPSRSPFRQGVRIMTAHKSKGQEFGYVYIMNAYDGHWGNKRREASLFHIPWDLLSVRYDVREYGENEDERRLFYVAMTRARSAVWITYSEKDLEDKEQTASQFIEEILPAHRQLVDAADFEKTFAVHPEQLLLPSSTAQTGQLLRQTFLSNKQFFVDLFTKRGLSVSGLNNYLECPWKFFYRNLLLLPDAKNKQLIFGSAIHESLNRYLITREKRPVHVEFLIEEYKKALSRQSVSEREYAELSEKGVGVLRDYYEKRAQFWAKGLESELPIRGIRFTEHIHLNGKIDMIERLGRDGQVRVYDFKTGKPKSRKYIEGLLKSSNGASGDYKRQLVFYKILLDRYKEGRYKMDEGVIEFIEPNDKGAYVSEAFQVTPDEVADLEKLILKVAGEIRELSFIDRTCDDPDCPYCRLKSFMVG